MGTKAILRPLPEITIRDFTRGDIPAFFALVDKDRDHFDSYGERGGTKYTSRERIEEIHFSRKDDDRYDFAICREDELVGIVSKFLPPFLYESIYIGYVLGKEHVGYGYATAAVLKVIEHTYSSPRKRGHIFRAQVHPDNLPSIAVLTRAGFNFSFISPVTKRHVYERPRSR